MVESTTPPSTDLTQNPEKTWFSAAIRILPRPQRRKPRAGGRVYAYQHADGDEDLSVQHHPRKRRLQPDKDLSASGRPAREITGGGGGGGRRELVYVVRAGFQQVMYVHDVDAIYIS